ncbi:hypothetical protein WA158_002438 [Blastocystis sp. Blastoise]
MLTFADEVCKVSTATQNFDFFVSGSNLWKVNPFGSIESFEGCENLPENTSAIRRYPIRDGLYKCEYLSNSSHRTNAESTTFSENNEKAVLMEFNGGDTCNYKPSTTLQTKIYFICNESAQEPTISNVFLPSYSCITEIYIQTSTSCNSTMPPQIGYIIGGVLGGIVVIYIIYLIVKVIFKRNQAKNRKTAVVKEKLVSL